MYLILPFFQYEPTPSYFPANYAAIKVLLRIIDFSVSIDLIFNLFNKTFFKPKLLKKDKPYGKCVFFDGNKCTIHPVKPLQCKTSINCKEYGEKLAKWFMLNHIIDVDDPESVRQYASYLKTGGKKLPGASLEELVPDKDRLKKILNFEILK